MIRNRVDAGDRVAIHHLGNEYEYGQYWVEKDVTRAAELYERAAELGVNEAHYELGCLYREGTDVEKDTAKAFQHWEAAAMCGHVSSRHNLGCVEGNAGNHDLALQHWMISSNLGDQDSLNNVKSCFTRGLARLVARGWERAYLKSIILSAVTKLLRSAANAKNERTLSTIKECLFLLQITAKFPKGIRRELNMEKSLI